MKLKFERTKGNRIHKRFLWVTNFDGLWWLCKSKKWVSELPKPLTEDASTCCGCKTVKAFKRHLRKHPIIKGKAVLVSRFEGFDVCG